MKVAVHIFLACGFCAASTGLGQPQTCGSLDEVVVTAKSLEEELPQQPSQYGAHLDTVTAAQMQNGGYLDVAAALEALAPGLYISSKTGSFDYAQISLQGLRTQHVLWLVDGIRINNRCMPGPRRSTPFPPTWWSESKCWMAAKPCSMERRRWRAPSTS